MDFRPGAGRLAGLHTSAFLGAFRTAGSPEAGHRTVYYSADRLAHSQAVRLERQMAGHPGVYCMAGRPGAYCMAGPQMHYLPGLRQAYRTLGRTFHPLQFLHRSFCRTFFSLPSCPFLMPLFSMILFLQVKAAIRCITDACQAEESRPLPLKVSGHLLSCLLYTSDAADE